MCTRFYVPFFFILSNCVLTTVGLHCRGENNERLDWFVVYKFPKSEDNPVEDGLSYVYATSENYNEWFHSKYSIDKPHSIIGNTLKPLFSKKNISYVVYNDQPPDESSNHDKGHTKGVLLAHTHSGLWLIHSVPHFPKLSSKYTFPKSGKVKGQSFLCISLNLKNLDNVGVQLQYNEPQIYASYVSDILKSKLSHVVEAASGIVIRQAPWYNQKTITSKNGDKFISFAKSAKFGKDLYHDWIAPTLKTDLLVETWLNGQGRLPSNCTNKVNVWNIQSVSLDGAIFSSSEDHSKWAISTSGSWICIGDINRMKHQEHRGGGSVCLNNSNLSEIYRHSVDMIEKCFSNIF